MNVQDRKPQPKDRVRVSFGGVASEFDDHGRLARVTGSGPHGDWVSYVPETAEVEVLEPVDDPSMGEVRRVASSLDGEPKSAVKVGASLSMMPSEPFLWMVVQTGELVADGNIDVGEVIGVVPGTPAAEAQGPLATYVRKDIDEYRKELAAALDKPSDWSLEDLLFEAKRVAVHARRDEAQVEWDLAASPWNGEPTSREPRVFPCPGPQPPQGMKVQRRDSDLVWLSYSGHMYRDGVASGLSWGAMVPGEYVEVLS